LDGPDRPDPALRVRLGGLHDRLGQVLALSGRHQEAAEAYERALGSFEASSPCTPARPESRRAQGLIHVRRGGQEQTGTVAPRLDVRGTNELNHDGANDNPGAGR